jgi:hypothetical protein
MRLFLRACFGSLLVLGCACAGLAQSVVSDWLDHAATTVVVNARKDPATSNVYFAYTAVAMYDAASSIDRHFKPFAVTVDAPAGAQIDAAVVTAAHDLLAHYFPDQQSTLDGELATSLAAISDGQAKTDGICVGKSVAAQWIRMRSGDGIEAKVVYTPGHGQGVWEPIPNVPAPAPNVTPPPVDPWFTQFRPLALRSPDQFISALDQPYALTSAEWAADFKLTRDYGAQKSMYRTPQQTEIGLFWTDGPAQVVRALRSLIDSQNLNTVSSARMTAMACVSIADAFAAAMSAKYHFAFWRPLTAIRNADASINPATVADPAWTPLAPTPGHPEYPANHGTITQAFMDALTDFFGTAKVSITFTSAVTHTTHTFSNLQDVVREVDNARVYGGMHYRHSVLQGNLLGRLVATYVCMNHFQPTQPM